MSDSEVVFGSPADAKVRLATTATLKRKIVRPAAVTTQAKAPAKANLRGTSRKVFANSV